LPSIFALNEPADNIATHCMAVGKKDHQEGTKAADGKSVNDRYADGPTCATAIKSTRGKLLNELLVVDDANEVHALIVWLLRSSGYRALAAADGPIA
jgi:hypothetical protein